MRQIGHLRSSALDRPAATSGGVMSERLTDADLEGIVSAAGAAPSLHNSQPWRFSAGGDEILLHGEADRALFISDPAARALYISCGAALFNTRLAVRKAGVVPAVRLLPHPEYPFDVLAVVSARPGAPATAAELGLFDCIAKRRTNRGPYADRQLPQGVRAQLQSAARGESATLHLLDRSAATAILVASAAAGRELSRDTGHQAELHQWIAVGGDDGIPAAALPPQPAELPAPVRVDDFRAAASAAPQDTVRYERFPQLAVLTTESDEPADWLVAGQALQAVLLAATSAGVSASFLYQPIELRDMRADDPPDWPGPEHPQMVIRFGYPQTPSVPVPRRRVDELLTGGQERRATPHRSPCSAAD